MSGLTWILLGAAVMALVVAVPIVIVLSNRSRTAKVGQRHSIELHRQAGLDLLTGLPSRAGIIEQIGRRMATSSRHAARVAVIHLDIDDFKGINDALGHVAGDELLIEFGARLAKIIGRDGCVGRVGSDEFIIVVDGATASTESGMLADRTLSRMQEPYFISSSSSPVVVGVSIGFAEGWRSSPEALMHDADVALSRAKFLGKSRVVVFASSMQAAAERRRTLEVDLLDALATHQFYLLYQPTFSLDSGRITGVEALLRWRHPTRGIVTPDMFIPSLESTGLIVAVGKWVLESACAQGAMWNSRCQELSVAVNISGRQLELDGIVGEVKQALRTSGLDPQFLTLELTETVLMNNVQRTLLRLQALKATGVRLAVDDFGTGYSSIAYLQKFPVDVIKIDQSFVGEMTESREGAALVHALIDMAAALGLETIAEGIETEEQRIMLRDEEVETGQGYLLGRPMEASAVDELLVASVA